MTTEQAMALATELEQISQANDRPGLAEAFARCRGPRDEILGIVFGKLSVDLPHTLGHTPMQPLTALDATPERVARAARVALFVEADAMLEAKQLESIDAILAARSDRSTAVLLTVSRETSAADLPNLERKAWRNFVPNSPSNPAGLALSDYNVFVIGETEDKHLATRIAQDGKALAGWCDKPASTITLDRKALLHLASRLDHELEASGNPHRPLSSEPSQRRQALERSAREQVVDRINRAFDEFERSVLGEIRQLAQETKLDLPHRIATGDFDTTLKRGVAAIERSTNRIAARVFHDLGEAIAEDLVEVRTPTEIRDIVAQLNGNAVWTLPQGHDADRRFSFRPTASFGTYAVPGGLVGGAIGAAVGLVVAAGLGLLPGVLCGGLIGAGGGYLRYRRIESANQQIVIDEITGEARSLLRDIVAQRRAALCQQFGVLFDAGRVQRPAPGSPVVPARSNSRAHVQRIIAELADGG